MFKLNFVRRLSLSLLCGILAGTAAAVFLISLDWATRLRTAHTLIIWALPIAGFFIGWVYHRYGKDVAAGNNLILDEIHDPKKTIPFQMAPFILFGTVLTHLFGGSAGREGTAVQMGASLSDQISRFFKVSADERKALLMAGTGAGFGAAIGAPLAGVVFGMEVLYVGRFKVFGWLECLVASFTGYLTAVFLKAPHSVFPRFEIPHLNLRTLFFVAVAGIAFGLAARIFVSCTHFVERGTNRWITYPPLKPFCGGLILVALYYLEGSYRYVGLGIPYIQAALTSAADFRDPALKALFTSLTIGTGFKGGEFIPLVFIGTALGSALSVLLPVSFQLLAALGFGAVFGGAANTPIACTVMVMEIFGYEIAPFALVACLMSYYFSGPKGIYRSQRPHKKSV
jgi:H+/Cl- antiporter ClcA